MNLRPIVYLLLLTMPALAAHAEDGELRVWRAASGNSEVKAVLKSVADGKAKLLKEDGLTVEVPLDLLSKADQEYCSKWSQSGAKDIFAGGVMESSAEVDPLADAQPPRKDLKPWRPGESPVVFDEETQRTAFQSMDRPMVESDRSHLVEAKSEAFSFALPALKWGERVSPLFAVDFESRRSVFCSRLDDWGKKTTRLVLVDPSNGKSAEIAKWDDLRTIDDADVKSGRLLGRVGYGSWSTVRELVVYSCGRNGKVDELLRWYPTAKAATSPPSIYRMWFLDKNHVVGRTQTEEICWDLQFQRVAWRVELHGFSREALSRGRRYFAGQNGNRVGVFEAISGKQLGSIPLPSSDPHHLAFSPSGTKLSAVGGRYVRVFDLTDPAGDHLMEMPEPTESNAAHPVWVDEDHLLLGGKLLVNPRKGFVVWKYDLAGINSVQHFRTGLARGLRAGGGQATVLAVPLPHSAALAVSAETNVESRVRMRAGDSVRLEVDLPPKVDRSKIMSVVEKAITKAGWRISSDATKRVRVVVYRGEERQGKYGSGTFKGKEYPYRPYVGYVEVADSSGVIWRVVDNGRAPRNLELGLNETPAEAIERQTLPNYRFFDYLQIPGRLLDPEIHDGFGFTKLEASGLTHQSDTEYTLPSLPARS